MTDKDLPLILRAEKARNELNYQVSQIAVKYDLPGFFIDLILEAVLSQERAQRIALIAEQITVDVKEDEHGGREDPVE
ncbi:hypothetical protein [Alloscardovia omnicolens]|uniref:hypothetical protein n=1 Tax=Alloscardovia omnicolens TaxID=419015 RepID=UPI003A78A28C